MKWISLILSVVSLLVSMVVLAKLWPVDSIGFDYIGAIVGILSFLITVLMGYQIYTVINVKDSLKEVQHIRSEIDAKLQDKVDSLSDDFKEELYQATPLIMAIRRTSKEKKLCI